MNPLEELQEMILKHGTEVGGSYFVDVSFAAVLLQIAQDWMLEHFAESIYFQVYRIQVNKFSSQEEEE
jgi:hypothetical protein